MAVDNTILIKAGFDLKNLEKEMKTFSSKFRNALNTSLKNLKIDLSKLDALKDLKIGLKIDLSGAKKQIDDFRNKLLSKPLEIATKATAATPAPKGIPSVRPGPSTTLLLDQRDIDASTRALEGYQKQLRSKGLTEKEITEQVRKHRTELIQIQKFFDAMERKKKIFLQNNAGIQGPSVAGGPLSSHYVPSDRDLDKFQDFKLRVDDVTTAIKSKTGAQAVANVETKRAEQFMDSFGFKVGILGFGIGILGGHLQRFSQGMLTFIQTSAQAVEPLERIRNLLFQDPGVSADERGGIMAEINRLADFPGSSLDATAKTFRSLRTLGLSTLQTLRLVEGLTKATARSGIGAEGMDRMAAQFRDFASTGQLKQQEVRSVISAGGIDIANIFRESFGGTSASAINKVQVDEFFTAVIEGLIKLPTPLETLTDKINRITNSFNRMRLNVSELIGTGLDILLEKLRALESVVASLGDTYRSLNDNQKTWASSVLISIPIITGALAALFTALAAVGIGLASGKHLLDAYRISQVAVSKQLLLLEGSVGQVANALVRAKAPIAGFLSTLGLIGQFFIHGELNTAITGLKSLFSGGAVLSGMGTFATGLARILGLLNPIGIAINLILAYITDFGSLRGSVNKGILDLVRGLNELYKSLKQFGDTSLGSLLVGVLQLVYDLLQGIFQIAGSAIGEIFSLLGGVAEFAAGILSAFNEETWTGVFNRLWLVINRFLFRGAQSTTRFASNVAISVVKVVGNAMEAMGLLEKGTVERQVGLIERLRDGLGSANIVIKDGKLALEAYSTSQENLADKLKDTNDELERQVKAFERLAEAAEQARTKTLKAGLGAREADIRADISELRQSIQTAISDFQDTLKISFTKEAVNSATTALQTFVKSQEAKIKELGRQLFRTELEGVSVSIKDDELIQSTKQAMLGISRNFVGAIDDPIQDFITVFNQGLSSIGDPKTIEEGVRILNEANTALRTIVDTKSTTVLNSIGLTRENITSFQVVIDSLLSQVNSVSSGARSDVNDFNKFLSDQRRSIARMQTERNNALLKEQQGLILDESNSDIDAQIQAKREQISGLRIRVERDRLTETALRLRTRELEEEMAKLEVDRDLAKIDRDRNVLDPGNVGAIASLELQRLNREREYQARLKQIRDDATSKQLDSDARVQALRNRRFQKSGGDLLRLLQPFESRIVNTFAAALLGVGDSRGLFKTLAGDLRLVGQDLPEVLDLANILFPTDSSGQPVVDTTNLQTKIRNYTDAYKIPLERELTNQKNELRKILTATVFSDPKLLAEGNISPFLVGLGIGPGQTEDQVAALLGTAKDLTAIQRFLEANAAVEELERARMILNELATTQAQIANIDANALTDFWSKIVEATGKKQIEVIDSQIAELNAQREKSLAEDAQRVVAIEGAKQNTLLREIINFETRKQILEAQYRAINLANQTKDAEAQKRIYANLQNEIIRIRAEALQRMTTETGGTSTVPTSTVPVGIPGSDEAADPGSPDAASPIVNTLFKISARFNDVYASARRAREELSNFFSNLSSGQGVLDAFAAMIFKSGQQINVFAEFGKFAAAAIGQAFSQSFLEVLTNGEGFIAGFGKILGDLLIMLGQALLQMGIAALAVGLIRFLFGDVTAPAMSIKAAAFATVAGAGLMVLGAAMGGGNASKTTSTNSSNAANVNTGAVGNQFDPNKDPRTVFQKALMAQISIDIKTDSGQIVKTVIKHVNQNGRLTKLIGNRRLGFTV